MVVAQLVTALAPFAPIIAVLVIALVVYFEGRGAACRWGTTAQRSSFGLGTSLALVVVVGLGLVFTGWLLYGGLVLAATLVLAAAWALSAKSKRWA